MLSREDIQELVRAQSKGRLEATNNHRITLAKVLTVPRQIMVINRQVKNGKLNEEEQSVWLVGEESRADGYRIVMRENDSTFGLASTGFPNDKHLILCGWYGDLLTAFLSM
jgi:hypothetical protein